MNNYKYKFFLVLFFTPIISMSQYETQEYELISNLDEIEIRYYPSSIMVKYIDDQNLNRGFKYLFRYISGGNDINKKIEMTTPVHMERGDKNSSMEFVLPREFSYKNAPKPNDSKVKVYESENLFYAAISYSGYTNYDKERVMTKKIKSKLLEKNIEIIGREKVLVYNSPYKFFNRRNEIIIPINYKKKLFKD